RQKRSQWKKPLKLIRENFLPRLAKYKNFSDVGSTFVVVDAVTRSFIICWAIITPLFFSFVIFLCFQTFICIDNRFI
ncbi:hypothetical protein, partial [Bacillus alveayuensis]|uniref:hypothetical protein n=1 Tax=Aeribacillus alveayuensis TaxID=279215 RepID=UPI001F376DC9